MARWQDLSAELMIKIASLAQHNDILSLASTCYHLHLILDPTVYHSITLTVAHKPRGRYRLAKERAFRQLVRSIILRPVIGTYVRSLNLIFIPNSNPLHEDLVSPRDFNQSVLPKTLWQKYGWELTMDDKNDLKILLQACKVKDVASGLLAFANSWGELVLLLHYLPRLRDLFMDTNAFLCIVGFAALGKLNGGIPAGLQSLQSLVVTNGAYTRQMRLYGRETARRRHELFHASDDNFDEYYDKMEAQYYVTPTFTAGAIVPFMCLPTLATLSVSHLTTYLPDTMSRLECFDSQPTTAHPPQVLIHGCSSLAKLKISSSNVGSAFMSNTLGLCRGLETLDYEVDKAYNDATIMFSQVIQDLSLSQSIIKVLRLYTTYQRTENSDLELNVDSKFHLLSSLTALTQLRVNVIDLLGPPPTGKDPSIPHKPFHTLALPSSLEFIELDLSGLRDNWQWELALQALDIQTCTILLIKKKMPNLRGIHLLQEDGRSPTPGWERARGHLDLGPVARLIGFEVQIVFIY